MITEAHGNLLGADAEALVNTVNTEGVMGKGIALQFRKAYPAMSNADPQGREVSARSASARCRYGRLAR